MTLKQAKGSFLAVVFWANFALGDTTTKEVADYIPIEITPCLEVQGFACGGWWCTEYAFFATNCVQYKVTTFKRSLVPIDFRKKDGKVTTQSNYQHRQKIGTDLEKHSTREEGSSTRQKCEDKYTVYLAKMRKSSVQQAEALCGPLPPKMTPNARISDPSE